MVDKLTQGQLDEFKKFAQDPEYFSLPLRNVSVYIGNTKIEGFAFDRGYQRKAARTFLHHGKMINLWCNHSNKRSFECVLMLWYAMFHNSVRVAFIEPKPFITSCMFNTEKCARKNVQMTVVIMHALYMALPEWLRNLIPATFEDDYVKFENGSRIIATDITKTVEGGGAIHGTSLNFVVLHGISRMSDATFRNFIASYFPCFFSGDPSRFRIIMSSEGGERDSSFEELCKMADDVTDTENGIAPDVPPYKIVLNAVRWKDLPPDEISKLLGVTVRQEKPWPYRDEFFLPG